MENASQALARKDSQAAAKEQQKAIEQLKKALDKVQDKSDRTEPQDPQQVKKLATLRQMAEGVLRREEGVRNQTEPLAAQFEKIGAGNPPLSLTIELQGLASEQGSLVTNVAAMLTILDEDATTVLVPLLVRQIHEDMTLVRDLLLKNVADRTVLGMEDTAIAGLKDLLDILVEVEKKKQAKGSQGGGGGKSKPKKGGGGTQQPLMPETAELKLVRKWQERLTRSTEALIKRLDANSEGTVIREQLRKHADRQKEIADSVNRLLGEAETSNDALEVK
jgi:hypothetical protein